MPFPTAFEQYTLELINRTRLDPEGEGLRLTPNGQGVTSEVTGALDYFNVDVGLFRTQMASFDSVAPLAWNVQLADAATNHAQYLSDNQIQSHSGPGGSSPGDRIEDAGYTRWTTWAENVYSYAFDADYAHAGFVIDWGNGTGGMQTPAGHRNAIMNGNFSEVGVGVVDNGAMQGDHVVVHEFANRWDYQAQLVGVVIDDLDGDDFYDIGEGMGGITVTAVGAAGTFSTTTWDAGGYQMVLEPGAYTVTFTGATIDGEIVREIQMGGQNLKLDAERADATPVAPTGPQTLEGGVEGDELVGSEFGDFIYGGGSGDVLVGLAGDDLLVGGSHVAGFDDVADDVYRLYRASLGRDPDLSGHLWWTEQRMEGMTQMQAARMFLGSPEFQTRFGAEDTTEFVNLLYQNVLGRGPNPEGEAFWVNAIDNDGMSRERVLLGFSNSAEFQGQTAAEAVEYTVAARQSAMADDVYRLYQGLLGRDPDALELEDTSLDLALGGDFGAEIAALMQDSAYGERFAAETTSEFVGLLYSNILGRAANASGLEAWVNAIDNGGVSHVAALRSFLQSGENTQRSQAGFAGMMETGSADADRLEGGPDDDLLVGGLGADTFVFASGDTGSDTIADFEGWDTVELSGFGLSSGAEALSHVTDTTDGALFSLAGTEILFAGLMRADLSEDDFSFV